MPSGETEVVARSTRRAAAKTASRLTAEQLEDSSDDEDTGSSLGGPSPFKPQAQSALQRTKPPAKSKSLHSSASLSHRRSARHSQPVSSGLEPSDARMQSNKLQPIAHPEALYISSSSASSDDDIIILDTPPPSATPRRKRPSEPQRPPRTRKKRKCSQPKGGSSSASRAGSHATPLSPPPPEAGPAKPGGSRVSSRDRTRLPDTRASPPREPRAPLRAVSRNASMRLPDAQYDMLDWDEDVLLVFVRVDSSGAPAPAGDAMWWPAQVCDARKRIWRIVILNLTE
ncbi:hypothetical protein PHLGIDRAFT_362744 [Phlebiopsis gigantea 11061_1 CR5-6]|uniref:Uncharacterized protein n=1 Tax=Phlebiopsis gigantea (strain 11061_1 CR5-6) TaxID=745531 RepID=A0A0C3PP84_PHLG1|nr:hypothetical protein PHLGIDRAFT_362744 [Phlebiopsis gigantea 11061_1 CR5-6]